MSLPHSLLSYTEANAVVRSRAASVRAPEAVEMLGLLEAQGRVLSKPVLADRDQPPFARSTRDGFAGRAADWACGSLTKVGLLKAGEAWHAAPLPPGTCIEIMTGAPVPTELDCVAMVEHVEYTGDLISLAPGRTIGAGENIVAAGAEAPRGATLLAAGRRLDAHGIAVAAACGYAQVELYKRPRAGILSTGDELVGIEQKPLQHQIRNSNSYTLAAQVLALGGEPLLHAPVRDEEEALKAAIADAAGRCDLLLLSGGVSMGKYDLVEPALAKLGAAFHFTGVRIQPGKPVVFGELAGLPFFGLPGNPVSAMVCFALFVAPMLAALTGESAHTPPFVQAQLGRAYQGKSGLTRFVPALLRHNHATPTVETIAWQGSGDLASTARANCFLVAPEDAASFAAGDTVTVLLA